MADKTDKKPAVAKKTTKSETALETKQASSLASTGKWVLVVVVVAVVFFAGMGTQRILNHRSLQHQRPLASGQQPFNGYAGGPVRTPLGTPVSGTVKSVDGKTFSVEHGSSTTKVQINDDTKITSRGSQDIKTGERVVVFGQANKDGTVQAKRITVYAPVSSSTTPSATQ